MIWKGSKATWNGLKQSEQDPKQCKIVRKTPERVRKQFQELRSAYISDAPVVFVDQDLDSSELGGFVTWNPPTYDSLVAQYIVYLARDNIGENRSQIGVPVDVGTNQVTTSP